MAGHGAVIYWALMPEFGKMNFFAHSEKLPHYYWDGDTKMNCMHLTLDQSLKTGSVYHIQRLMISRGNLPSWPALILMVDEWYLVFTLMLLSGWKNPTPGA
ncbi:MAG: hypothetical protein R2875_14395 [Desulfobacterales bacterium]